MKRFYSFLISLFLIISFSSSAEALITRNLTNVGDPLTDGRGTLLNGVKVTFTLVDSKGKATDAWDLLSYERVAPGPISAITDSNGEFNIPLWPNTRGDKVTYWLCKVEYIGVADVKGAISGAGVGSISWVDFKFASTVPTVQQYNYLNSVIADANARFQWKSVYVHGTQYYTNDAVFYAGSTYRAKRNNINIDPVVGDDWEMFAQQGLQGATGPGNGGYTLVSSYSNLTAAIAAIGNINKTKLLLDAPTSLNGNTEVTSNIQVVGTKEGLITSNGFSLTYKTGSSFEAGNYKVYDASGNVEYKQGAVDHINPAWWGASPNAAGYTNYVAFQSALNAIKISGAKLYVESDTYKISDVLTLIETVSSASAQTWILDFNGATLSWVDSGLTTGSLLKLGADSLDHAHEGGFLLIKNLKIIGPEPEHVYRDIYAEPPAFYNPTPTGNTSCLHLKFALDVSLNDVLVTGCYRGLYVESSWPVNGYNVNSRSNYIGMHLGSTCTLGTWVGCAVTQAAYGLVIQPDVDDDVVHAQTFVNLRLENSLRGITLDPRSGSAKAAIRDISFINPRFESIAYDLFRAGQAWEYSNPSSAGADRNNFTQSIIVHSGEWDDPLVSGYSLRFGTNNCRGWDMSLPIGQTSKIFGTPILSKMFIMPSTLGGTDSGSLYLTDGGTHSIQGNIKLGAPGGSEKIYFNSRTGYIDNSFNFATSNGTYPYVLHLDNGGYATVGTADRTQGGEIFAVRGMMTGYNPTANANTSIFILYSDYGSSTSKKFEILADGRTYNPTGAILVISDLRYKKDVTFSGGFLDKLNQIQVIDYRLIDESDSSPKRTGVSAQDVEKVLPELISIMDDNGKDKKTVNITGFIPMLLKAIQELDEKIKAIGGK